MSVIWHRRSSDCTQGTRALKAWSGDLAGLEDLRLAQPLDQRVDVHGEISGLAWSAFMIETGYVAAVRSI